MDSVERIGMPEARIILAQVTTYCATAPKSNASYIAIDEALADIKNERVKPIPKHLRDAHYKGAKNLGHGIGYQYPHSFEGGFVAQDYMGIPKKYYSPVNMGYESKIRERITYWDDIREATGKQVVNG
jgi:putative ATPase